jgi:hypothetical protein
VAAGARGREECNCPCHGVDQRRISQWYPGADGASRSRVDSPEQQVPRLCFTSLAASGRLHLQQQMRYNECRVCGSQPLFWTCRSSGLGKGAQAAIAVACIAGVCVVLAGALPACLYSHCTVEGVTRGTSADRAIAETPGASLSESCNQCDVVSVCVQLSCWGCVTDDSKETPPLQSQPPATPAAMVRTPAAAGRSSALCPALPAPSHGSTACCSTPKVRQHSATRLIP